MNNLYYNKGYYGVLCGTIIKGTMGNYVVLVIIINIIIVIDHSHDQGQVRAWDRDPGALDHGNGHDVDDDEMGV